IVRNLELARIHPEAGQDAAGPQTNGEIYPRVELARIVAGRRSRRSGFVTLLDCASGAAGYDAHYNASALRPGLWGSIIAGRVESADRRNAGGRRRDEDGCGNPRRADSG